MALRSKDEDEERSHALSSRLTTPNDHNASSAYFRGDPNAFHDLLGATDKLKKFSMALSW
jgi:hypothetical protein